MTKGNAGEKGGVEMSRRQKRQLYRIITAGVLLALSAVLPLAPAIRLAGYLLSYGVIGWDILWKALKNITHGQVFDENF